MATMPESTSALLSARAGMTTPFSDTPGLCFLDNQSSVAAPSILVGTGCLGNLEIPVSSRSAEIDPRYDDPLEKLRVIAIRIPRPTLVEWT